MQAARAAAMLRRDLGVDVTLETGPDGSFQVRVDAETIIDAGALAFLGVLPTLDEIRARVAERLDNAAPDLTRGP